MVNRTFNTEYLNDLDLPDSEYAVHTEQTNTFRWGTEHRVVFRTDENDGRLWSTTYYRPATERQEGSGEPWGYGYHPTTVEATEVKPVTKIVEITEYEPID